MSKDFLLLYDVDLQLLVNICNANLSQEKFLRVQFTAQHNYQHSVKYTGNMSYSAKGRNWKFSLQNSPEILVQMVGCIWKTGYNTPLQISINEHTKRLIRHPRPRKRHIVNSLCEFINEVLHVNISV